MFDYYEVEFGCKEESYRIIVETTKSFKYVMDRADGEARDIAKDYDSCSYYSKVSEYTGSDEELVVEEW